MKPPKLSRPVFDDIDNECCRLMLVTEQEIADVMSFLISNAEETPAIKA